MSANTAVERHHRDQIVHALAPLPAASKPEIAEAIVERFGLRRLSTMRGASCPCWWFERRVCPRGHAWGVWGGPGCPLPLPQGFDHMVWALDQVGRRILVTQPYSAEAVETWGARFGAEVTHLTTSAYGLNTECFVLVQARPFVTPALLERPLSPAGWRAS